MFSVVHPSMPLICPILSSPLVNLPLRPCRSFSSSYRDYIEHFLQHPPASQSLILTPFLSCPPLLAVCRIGEAYRLATTIKVQQVSAGSSHHWSKLRKPSCDQQHWAEREEKRERVGHRKREAQLKS